MILKDKILLLLRRYYKFILLPTMIYLMFFITYYYVTAPELFMFAYCEEGFGVCEGPEIAHGLTGDFIIPMLSYEEAQERISFYDKMELRGIVAIAIGVIYFIFHYRNKIWEAINSDGKD